MAKSTTNEHGRSIWLAAFLSFILPGFGQLYNGRWNRALGIMLAFATSFLFFLGWGPMYVPDAYAFYTFAASFGLSGLIWIGSIIDAILLSRYQRHYQLQHWQTLPVYLTVLLFMYIGVFKGLGAYTRTHVMEPFRIPSQSMLPGIEKGDFVFADKNVNCKGCGRQLQRGDVALFLYPKNRNLVFIKRIIGLPGDVIEISGSAVKRNGRDLTQKISEKDAGKLLVTERGHSQSYSVQWTRPNTTSQRFEVPSDHVFVLGDNRNQSQDSRTYGSIPVADVIGVSHHIWLALDDNHDIRWSRLGKLTR